MSIAYPIGSNSVLAPRNDAKRIRVLHVVGQLDIGGMEKLLVEFARHADRSRFELHFLALGNRGTIANELERLGWPVSALRIGPGFHASLVFRLSRFFRRLKADVVHTHNVRPLIYAGLAARIGGIARVIHTRHGPLYRASSRTTLAFRLASWTTNSFVCVSHDTARLSAMEGVSPYRIRTLWNGIDLDRFRPSQCRKDAVVIGVGRLSPEKDFATLIRATAIVAREDPAFRLEIAGGGQCGKELQDLISELRLDQNVQLLGEVENISALLSRGIMFVLPSQTEGISLTILEAMASGLPVVTTRVGGNPELVTNGETGLLVPPGNAAALAGALLELWRDPERRAIMGMKGRKRVETYFDVRRMVTAYEELYLGPVQRNGTSKIPALKGVRDENRTESGRKWTAVYRNAVLPFFEGVIKRRGIFRYWAELEGSQWFAKHELEQRQLASLRRLLKHAAHNCNYYRDEWERLGLSPDRVHSLEDFLRWPVITRNTIRKHRIEMRAVIPGLRIFSKATGGSSGVPLLFDLNMESHERRVAAMYRGYNWAGAAPGTKQLFLWGVPLGDRSSWKRLKDRLYDRLQRRLVLNSFEFSRERVPEFLGQLNRYRPDVIVAYTTPLYEFARILSESRLTPYSPRSIIVGAEKIYPFQREMIERVFQAPVFETYGSREVMLIGAECEKHAGLHLTTENLLVEVLDDKGQRTPIGEEGNVVITDLTNYGMPFIRYVNGDRAIAGWTQCTCGRGLPMMRAVKGRQLDLIKTPDGRCVAGEFFPHLIKDFTAVERFQVVQEAIDRVEIRLVTRPEWSESDRGLLIHELRKVLGPAVCIEINNVDEIPLTAVGKHRVVVSKIAVQPTKEEVDSNDMALQPEH